jgi:aspartate/methionine/tyrosine aminotransferase
VYSYGPHQGLAEFKDALANQLAARKNYQLSSDTILPIDSAASGMYAIVAAYIKPGDEMIIFDPVDYLFEQAVLAAGGRVVRCPFDYTQHRFNLSQLEQLVSEKTRMIGVCNPHNPLGLLMTGAELTKIAELAEQYDLWILNDEIWSDIVYPEQTFVSFHHLPKSLQKRVFTVYGFSKAFALAGLRVGAIFSPDLDSHQKVIASSHVMTTAGGVSTISQIAATTAISQCWYWVDEFIGHLTELRDYAVNRLNKMPGISCHYPQATYLLFANIEQTGLSSEQLVELLNQYKVAVVPGNASFFGPSSQGHIRICFSTSYEILKQGLDRIEQALLAHQSNIQATSKIKPKNHGETYASV